jgi:hypothetical protein
MVGIGGADDDLNIRVGIPDMLYRFETVPARGHPHIDKSQCVRAIFAKGLFNLFVPFFSLRCEVEFILVAVYWFRGTYTKRPED